MKPRNREINIFNLSMLDVICGALGAFLILFLIAAPYYGNTANQAQPPGQKVEDQFLFMTSWEQANTDFDLWVMKPDKSWAGPQGRRLFGRIVPGYEFDNVDGRQKDTTWFETYRRTDPDSGAYVIVGQLVNAPPGAAAGIDLRGFASIDLRTLPYQNQASIKPVRFGEGEVRVVAVIALDRKGRTRYFEFEDRWDGGDWPARVQTKLDDLAAGK